MCEQFLYMRLELKRIYTNTLYTIGRLYVDGAYFCDTLEDRDRMLDDSMPENEIMSIKVKNQTAIPTGTYRIDMHTISPRYSKIKFYKELCNGKMPRILNVKGFSGILIHPGNTNNDTCGCILVGKNREKGMVLDSKDTWLKLYYKLLLAKNINDSIYITITRNY